jgi:hypothetical protein
MRAPDQARWVFARLVNRTDVWGGYWREQTADGPRTHPTTRPNPRDRGKALLTQGVLAQHFRACEPRHVVGLHSTSPNNTSKWAAVDLDWHGPTSTAPETNLAAALHWYDALRGLGFRPLLTDSNGKGGYHLLTVFAEAVSTARAFAFVRWLTRNHAILGLPNQPEVFPKQPAIRPDKFGNWLRVPGRHHTLEHWSRVWNGTRWLADAEAVSFILGLDGDPVSLIPDAAMLSPSKPAPSFSCRYSMATSGDLSGRIRRLLAKLPTGLGEGEHRDDHAYRLAAFLVRDLQLADDVALLWLLEWDRGNRTPKGEARLREIIQSAHLYGQRAYGAGLGDSHSRGRAKGFEMTVKVKI